ncbi:Periplasmic oligopeptide-binding protein precursor [Lacunisphaera limnophila]|uniref:Periplasmic oligopeptide-binding protein n=1 Tax=Lacunisphaera limnophila TaxID=1838286 RepID=A0A1D8AVI9_9BACT|nr:ABC transporter substrate-binding protein [Lacunisphaera limnophila]AOS44891.1 Periplasmic oligopeptide-binding protein precursor [Lacunisphaera limnophila]
MSGWSISRRSWALCALGVLCGLGAGCTKTEPAADSRQVLRLAQRNEPATLDPHLATLPDEFFVIRALSEGLLTPNPAGGPPLPGVAARWNASPDGLVYTFHLRPDARWADGTPVTAGDFVFSIRRALTAATAAPKAPLYFALKNARDFLAGRVPDFTSVGVAAPDEHTLVLTLARPAADFPSLVASGPWIPVHAATLAAHGDRWTRPGLYLGNGPFVLAEWKPNQRITLRRNPHYWDTAAIHLDEIQMLAFTSSDTEERTFRAGQLDVSMTVPFAKLDSYRRTAPELLQTVPLHETRYIALNTTRPPLNDLRVRRALSLALDRAELVHKVLKGGQLVALNFVPPGLGGYVPEAALTEDAAEARRLLAAAGYPGGRGFPRLELTTWGAGNLVLEAIQQRWRSELGITIPLVQREAHTHLVAMAAGDYDLAYATAIPDYDAPPTCSNTSPAAMPATTPSGTTPPTTPFSPATSCRRRKKSCWTTCRWSRSTSTPRISSVAPRSAAGRRTLSGPATTSMSPSPMNNPPRALVLLCLAATTLLPAAAPDFSAARILDHTRVLASDAFEGRAPGTPGEEKTVAYLVGEFEKLGLTPGNPDGSWVQNVPLVGITSLPSLAFELDGRTLAMEPINDYIGYTTRVAEQLATRQSEVVFVGYGVVAPEYGWDDYKGVDVRGKTVVMLVNDPPVTKADGSLDDTFFKGKAMTYYGRWTYKYEIAAAKGAAGCLIVHETGPAGYPFAVLVGSNTRENFTIASPDGNAGDVAFSGWLTIDGARKLFTAAGRDYDIAKAAAARADFRPVTLPAKAAFTIAAQLRNVASRNVVGLLPGSDPQLKDEYVVYTAHWDHLGRDERLPGDQIYNGAADNAAGTAVLLELARAFAALPPAERPRRSLLFLSVTAEEKGLLGSRYYATHPLYPLERTVANINMDGANQFGPTEDVVVVGSGATTIEAVAATVAAEQGRSLSPDPRPEVGSYYRSDHFEFAKVGVPAFYGRAGRRFIGLPPDFAEKLVTDYIANRYHKVTDEVQPDWTFTGAEQDAAFLFEVGRRVANDDTWPAWQPGNEFKARRDAMLAPR